MIEFKEVPCLAGFALYRAEIPGGWLVATLDDVRTVLADGRVDRGHEYRHSLAFVPDPEHKWEEIE